MGKWEKRSICFLGLFFTHFRLAPRNFINAFWYFRHVGKIPNSMGSNPSVSLEFFFFIPLESLITFGSTIQPTMEPDT